jgi:glycosyltransferase involved in cell wall biosynthesis
VAANPRVSIGICALRPEYLELAIRSVVDQEYDDLEVVVTDDLGAAERVVGSIADPRVRYHRNARRMGVAGNARVAFNLARGRYIGLLGDDDRLLPGYLEQTVRRLDEDPELGLVFTNYYCEENGNLYRRSTALRDGRYDDFLRSYIEKQRVPMSATLMRREVWTEGERAQPLPDDVAPDLFVFTRAALAGWPFSFIDRPLMAYRLHEAMTSRNVAYRDFSIAVWEQFSFDDPFCESHRRRLLAEGYVARGAAAVRAGRARAAQADFTRARNVDPVALRRHRIAYGTLARIPVFVPLVESARRAIRRVRPGREYTHIDRDHPVPLTRAG